MLASAIRTIVGTAPVKTGKVKLDIPPLVENGNTVPMTVSVDSPMAARITSRASMSSTRKIRSRTSAISISRPQAGRAQVATRIRLADSQKVVAIAKLSDGTFWSASVDVVVTLAACTEEVI